jgi:translation initiation factor 2 gamma subunit (eIF-2gamma)
MEKRFAQSFAQFVLEGPVYAPPGGRVALSRRIQDGWKSTGWAEIITGRIVPFQ